MKRINFVILTGTLVVFILVVGCGKKGPPFIPEKQVPHRVKELKGEWKNSDVHLTGKVAETGKDGIEISGCKVYYAWYSKKNEPCEDCPISFKELETIKGNVVKGSRFKCLIPNLIKKQGIHFFRVRLMGSDGEVGPFSDKAKVVSE